MVLAECFETRERGVNKMGSFFRRICLYSGYVAACALAAMLLLTIMDVFLRNAFLVFIPGVFELTRVMLAVIVLFALLHLLGGKRQGGADS